MSTDTPGQEEGQTPEEQLQNEAPAAPGEENTVAEPVAAADAGGSDLPELTLGAGAPADELVEAMAPSIVRGKLDKDGTAIGTGRRKTSVARVRIKDGDGKFVVNGRDFSEYFSTERDQKMVQEPLTATDTRNSVDVWVRVNGGGTTGQTGAVILGIARALEARNELLHHTLSVGGFLSRDDRMVERKKYGRRKARRSFQFSKR
ncbi:30S ribosomal protein S9 [bacterium]|nr:30S ribosomal protein S9 [bacterium]